MEAFFIILALLLPILLGKVWLNVLAPRPGVGGTAIAWGYGTLLGLLVLPRLMLLLDTLGIPLNFALTGGVMLLLTALGLFARRLRRAVAVTPQPLPVAPMIPTHKWLFALLLALIALRSMSLGLEIFWRPLFPWDATMHWATKARVWFEYQSIEPFVKQGMWLNLRGEGVFTDEHPYYQATIPLLQVWMNLAINRWDESLMNLPWLLCYIAMGTAFYGQLRHSGASALLAMTFTYLLMSLPLVNIHVALAGYADLFLGATYCCALMALHNWSVDKQAWQAWLALIFALLCPFIKNEGLVWGMTLVPALATILMPRREAAKLYLLFCLLAILAWLVIPEDIVIAGITVNQLIPTFDAAALEGIIKSVWQHNNWNLLGYLFLVLIPLGVLMPGAMTRTYLPVSIALASAGFLFLVLFLFTGFGWAAANFTAVGRLGIQLAPGMVFLAALLFNEIASRGSIRSPTAATAIAN